MFTGLVTDVGTIVAISEGSAIRRVSIRTSYGAESVALGASVACGGPCLTVVDVKPAGQGSILRFDLGAETLDRTTARAWSVGARINLERSLRVGDELGGHIVTGHIDGVAEVLSVEAVEGMSRFGLGAPARFMRFIAEKGSVCLDGTSLTVNGVSDDDFTVLLIPHTLAVTSWGDRRAGDKLNLEVDLMARYAARLAEKPF